MGEHSTASDMGLGLLLAFSALALIGAGILFGAPTQLGGAWGFLIAIVAASLAVSVIHIFGE